MRLGLLAGVIAFSLFVVIAAAAAGPHWTPKQMQAAIQQKKFGGALVPDFPTRTLLDTSIVTVTTAKCRGLGSHTRKGYALFRCHVTWSSPNLGGGPFAGDFWTVPWTKSLCITDVSRGSCPPPLPRHPLPGDPRKCAAAAGNVICIAEAAGLLARKGQTVVNESCVAGAVWTTYNCTWNAGGATVKFVRHPGRWTTSVTPLTS
jgi:hypothetical protein